MTTPAAATVLETPRLLLTPLRVEDADEMVTVLDDVRLHAFIGGQPAALDDLRDRYRTLLAGPADGGEIWLNWIVRLRDPRTAVGTMQATISPGPPPVASVAWTVGVPWQRRGIATEAARALVGWLRESGVDDITANIRPDHVASARVAARAGLEPTDDVDAGEVVWRSGS